VCASASIPSRLRQQPPKKNYYGASSYDQNNRRCFCFGHRVVIGSSDAARAYPAATLMSVKSRPKHDVRFTPKADMCSALADVRFVPIADMRHSFDHHVGAIEESRGNIEL
jgi:hypothetical protein